MMVAETTLNNGPWTAGGPATVRGLDPGRQPYVGRGCQFGGTHRGGVIVAFADGSFRFHRDALNPKLFEAISTVAGAEPLPIGWDR
jgi:prepilin-type processing-associated H-X9-DG protein